MALGRSPTPPEIRSPERDRAEDAETEEEFGDAFDIPHKNASHDRLRRWRQAALVLNASRRFRYTLDLKKEEEKEMIRRKIRAHAQVIRAALLFKEAGEKDLREAYTGIKLAKASHSFPIELEKLTTLNRDHDSVVLQEIGGVKGLSDLLKSNLDRGISPNKDELLQRRDVFGANTYPRKKRKNILRFVFEASKDLTLIILMVAAAISLTLGMTTEGVDEGWYDGGSIFLAVFLVILVTAISDYRQSLQFRHLNEEKQNIQVEGRCRRHRSEPPPPSPTGPPPPSTPSDLTPPLRDLTPGRRASFAGPPAPGRRRLPPAPGRQPSRAAAAAVTRSASRAGPPLPLPAPSAASGCRRRRRLLLRPRRVAGRRRLSSGRSSICGLQLSAGSQPVE